MDLVSITGALQSIPAGMQNRMQQAASRLIGAVAKIPKAWIDAKAQSITDRAAASHAMQKALVEASKKHLKLIMNLLMQQLKLIYQTRLESVKTKLSFSSRQRKTFRKTKNHQNHKAQRMLVILMKIGLTCSRGKQRTHLPRECKFC